MGFHMPYANGHISATGDQIHFMFGYRIGFSGTADLMALFSIRTNSRWWPPPSWIISNGHISAAAHDDNIYLYSTHRAGHLCDSTAFLLRMTVLALMSNKLMITLRCCMCYRNVPHYLGEWRVFHAVSPDRQYNTVVMVEPCPKDQFYDLVVNACALCSDACNPRRVSPLPLNCKQSCAGTIRHVIL